MAVDMYSLCIQMDIPRMDLLRFKADYVLYIKNDGERDRTIDTCCIPGPVADLRWLRFHNLGKLR